MTVAGSLAERLDRLRSTGSAEYAGFPVATLLWAEAESAGGVPTRRIRQRDPLALRILNRLQREWRQRISGEWLHWRTGDAVFLPGLDNNLNPMLPVMQELDRRGRSLHMVLPETARGWRNLRRTPETCTRSIDRRVDLQASPLAEEALQAFTAELDSFLEGTDDRLRRWLLKRARERIARIEYIRRRIRQRRPACFLSSRPKRDVPLAYLVAAWLEGVPCVLLLHTAAIEHPTDKRAWPDDLFGLFSLMVVHSTTMRDALRTAFPSCEVIASGWGTTPHRADAAAAAGRADDRLHVGYPLGGDHELVEPLARAAQRNNFLLVIKGRPPGGDRGAIQANVPAEAQGHVRVYAHGDIDLTTFLADLDILVAGRTNVGFEAMEFDLPVISLLSERERVEYERRAVEPRDFASECLDSVAEVDASIARLETLSEGARSRRCAQQRRRYRAAFPPYAVEPVADRIESLMESQSACS